MGRFRRGKGEYARFFTGWMVRMTAYLGTSAGAVRSGLTNAAGTGLLLLSVIGAIGVFWFGLVSLGEAWATPEYSHGPVIPLLSAYMFLIEMRRVPRAEFVHDRAPGVSIVFAALLIGVIGNIVRIPDIVTYALILWIWGMVLTVFGLRRGWILWPAVLHLIFMLPLPQVVYWQFSTWLQQVSSEIGVSVIGWFAVPVYLDGNVIDLGVYKLQVAEACSGLRYLFPVMSFSYVFGVLYTGPRWHKIALFLAAAPITVLMNSFRIGVIGVLVDRFGISHAEGFLHTFEGWIIFVACILILFGIAVLLQQTRRNPQPIADTLEIDLRAVMPQLRRILDVRPDRAIAVASVAALAVATTTYAFPEPERIVPERIPLALFPSELGDWQVAGMPQRLEPKIEGVLGADDYFLASFRNPKEAAPVDLFIAYYDRQTEGSWIHSPEICLPNGGWEVSDWKRTTLTLGGPDPGGDEVSLPANAAIIQKGLSRQLVLYWFEQRGRRMTDDYVVKATTLWDALRKGRTDGGLVRVITQLSEEETVADAEKRLIRFLGHSLGVLPRFIPG